jgi:glycosyltransferase involved in cell wall biosynthesis
MPDGVNAVLGFPAFFNPRWVRAIGRTARRQRARAIVVRDLPLALTAAFVGRLLGIPVVLDMAENYPAMIQDVWDAGRARLGDRLVRNPRVIGFVERLSVRLADHILEVVDESRDRLAAMGVPASKMSVVMNTPLLAREQDLVTAPDERPARRADELVIAYLGLLEAPRGLGTAIRAMGEVRRRLPQARLMVIGSGRDEALFQAEARARGLTDCVEFLGWRDYRDALADLSRCDVGLVPHHATASWQTTIPNKLFDYMSLSKPVIVSNARPTERIVTEEQCGVVFAEQDPAALAQAIVAMSDPAVREACGRRGREAIVRRYNWEADERRLLAVVRSVTEPVDSGGEARLRPAPAPTSQGSDR